MSLDRARDLAAYYALRDFVEGRIVLSADTMRKVDALLRPFAPPDRAWSSVLDLETPIAALEAEFPAAARTKHLTRAPAPVPC